MSKVPAGAHLFLAHGISANVWLAENAVVSGNSITAEVSHLSLFKMVICLRGVNIRDCLARQLVIYVAEKLVKDPYKKLIDDVANQCGDVIDGTPACKLGDGSLPPSLSPHGPNPTITAPSGPGQGVSVPVQGGSAPVQGGGAPIQGGSAPVQGGTAPVQGGSAPPIQGQPAPPPTMPAFHGGFAASVSPYATTGDSGHKGPGNQYTAGPTYPAGTTVNIYCYVNGESITNSHYNDTTAVWDLSDDGYWYTDAWLYTGKNGPAVPACG